MSTRSHIETLEREQADRAAKLEALKALDTAESTLAQTQGEVSVASQELATLRAAVLAEGGKLTELEQQHADARKVLVELGAEREGLQREIQTFARIADEQTKRFRLELQGLVSEPEMTE
jgi:chromosome segregation ATPase